MDRFKILKGQEPPLPTEEQRQHAKIVRLWESIADRADLPKLLRMAKNPFIRCEYPGNKLWTDSGF